MQSSRCTCSLLRIGYVYANRASYHIAIRVNKQYTLSSELMHLVFALDPLNLLLTTKFLWVALARRSSEQIG